MSRSFKKSPVISITTSKSEKYDKQLYNRKLRKSIKSSLAKEDYDNLKDLKDVSNPWSMSKDGKWWVTEEVANELEWNIKEMKRK